MISDPLVTIGIPAFEYPEGIERILGQIVGQDLENVEIIIQDDSSGEAVRRVVERYSTILKRYLVYQKNVPPLGAPANWNSIIEKAKGHYLLLLHHDEVPLGPDFVSKLKSAIERDCKSDVFLMNLMLISRSTSGRLIFHLPMSFKLFVVMFSHSYLLKRNVIGPCSMLLVRRILYPRFDNNLSWLVDVDLYFRLREKTCKWKALPHVTLVSYSRRPESITSKLGSRIRCLQANETDYLRRKYSALDIYWLRIKGRSFVGLIESAVWYSVKISIMIVNAITRDLLKSWHKYSS